MNRIRLILFLLLSVALAFSQTSPYPTALDTTTTLTDLADRAQTTLSASLNSSATSFTVVSGSKFSAGMILTIDNEQIKICQVVTNTVSVGNASCPNVDGRGFAGTSAASHTSGTLVSDYFVSWQFKAVRNSLIAVETTLGTNLANVSALIPNPTPINKGGTNAQTQSAALSNILGSSQVPIANGGTGAASQSAALTAILGSSQVPVANGGTGVATAQGNGAKVQLSTGSPTSGNCTKFDANGNTADNGAPCFALPSASAQALYFRTKPNSGNNTTYEFAALPVVNAADYNWLPQTPGGSLTGGGGSQTITLTPCPLGLVNSGTYATPLYLSGGTGTAESVTGTGGTCTSGASTGTVIVSPVNSHSGAWTIASSTAGIMEAIAANPGKEVHIPKGTYTMRAGMVLNPDTPLLLSGDGTDRSAGGLASLLDFSGLANGVHAISMSTSTVSNFIHFRDFELSGKATAAAGDGFHLVNVVRVRFSGMQISGFSNGIYGNQSFDLTVDGHTHSEYNALFGIYLTDVVNLVTLRDSYFNFNSRSTNGGGIGITCASTHPNAGILIEGNSIEGNGLAPFTSVANSYGVYQTCGNSVTLAHNYLESAAIPGGILVFWGQNFGAPYTYVTSLTEYGNWINGGGIVYSAYTSSVRSWGNTFYGATAVRTFQNTDLSTYDIGPDTCQNTSAECTTHARLLGNVSSLSVTANFTTAVGPNYIATESGSNNAIAGALTDTSGANVALAAGLRVTVKLAHTLQAGANTFVFNTVSKNIKSARNVANNIGTAYAATGTITLLYDGTEWVDISQ